MGNPPDKSSSQSPEEDVRSRSLWRRLLLHPLAPLIVFMIGSVYLKSIDEESNGEFYPFSNFPMYANPRNRDLEYYFLQGADEEPIASFQYTGYTAARVKKLMRSASMKWGKDQGLKWNKKSRWLTDEVKAEIAEGVLAHLRKRSEDRGTPLPASFSMVRGIIFVDEAGEFRDRAEVVATNTVPADQ